MIKIIDFDDGCGGLTSGMELFGEFEVIYNGDLCKKNELCYNKTHKNDFWTGFSLDYSFFDDLNIQVASFTFNFGGNLGKSGAKKFNIHCLDEKKEWISQYLPEVIIIQTPVNALSLLNDNKINKTSDDWPIADNIVNFLKNDTCSYKNVVQFVLEYPNFSIPQRKLINFYVAWNNNHDFYIPISDGKNNNIDIMSVLNNVQNKSWHDKDYRMSEICSKIKQGSSASQTDEVSQKKGYSRLFSDKIAPALTHEFYKASCDAPSIHPFDDRPLTIREGARLHGLDDRFDWDKALSKKDVAQMIHNSVSPRLGYYIGKSIFDILQ